jgi:transposase
VELLVARCAGLDVANHEVVACVRVPDGRGGRAQQVRTDVPDVHLRAGGAGRLAGRPGGHPGGDGGHGPAAGSPSGRCWSRQALRCCWQAPATSRSSPAARPMSATRPGWPGLLEHGLLRGSFVPPAPIRQLHDPGPLPQAAGSRRTARRASGSTRPWRTPASSSTRSPLEVLGASGRAMLAALVAARARPRGACRAGPGAARAPSSPSCARRCERGRFRSHHALPVRLALAHLEQLEASIAELDAQVDRVLVPFAQARDPLDTITGVGKRAPRVHDRARSGWTCRCSPPPRTWRGGRAAVRATTPTGGKRRSGTTTKGNRWLGEVLTRVRVGGDAQPRHVPVGPVLAAGLPHRQEEGSHRRGATLFW